jgi:hypothetical protein
MGPLPASSTPKTWWRWFNKQLTSREVQAEMPAILERIDRALDPAMISLSRVHGWDASELAQTWPATLDRLPTFLVIAMLQP